MTIQDNEQLIRKLYRSFEKNDMNEILSYFAPDMEFRVMGMDEVYRGHEQISEGFKSWSQTFPDMKGEIVSLIPSNDWVVVEEINRGTHKGLLEMPEGNLPATNRKIEVPACNLFKISNGKIVSWKLYWMSDVMMKQLGFGPQKLAA